MQDDPREEWLPIPDPSQAEALRRRRSSKVVNFGSSERSMDGHQRRFDDALAAAQEPLIGDGPDSLPLRPYREEDTHGEPDDADLFNHSLQHLCESPWVRLWFWITL